MDNGYISPSIFAENRERCGTKILSTGDLEQINDFAKRTLVPRKVWYSDSFAYIILIFFLRRNFINLCFKFYGERREQIAYL